MTSIDHATSMNETDVREEIVRPFLHRLGYRFGTENHIRTEITLRYPRQFLGRKDTARDPDLQGRADYICEVIGSGRWVVEAKPGNKNLTQDDAEQAHTYACHPEVAATYYLLTNGRVFQVFAASKPAAPIAEWTNSEIDKRWVEIANLLGPDAIRKRTARIAPSVGKPLAPGLGSTATIMGGFVTVVEYTSNSPQVTSALKIMQGMRSSVSGDLIKRGDDGSISISLRVVRAFSHMDALDHITGINPYKFDTSDEYMSIEAARPTIFEGFVRATVPAGAKIEPPFVPTSIVIPFPMKFTAITRATGYLKGDRCVGTFVITHHTELDVPMAVAAKLASTESYYEAYGDFELALADTA